MRAILIILTLAALALTLADIMPGEIVCGIAAICGAILALVLGMGAAALLHDENERQ